MVYILRAGIVAGWEWATSDVGGRERRQRAAHKTPASPGEDALRGLWLVEQCCSSGARVTPGFEKNTRCITYVRQDQVSHIWKTSSVNISKTMYQQRKQKEISTLLHTPIDRHEGLNVSPITYTISSEYLHELPQELWLVNAPRIPQSHWSSPLHCSLLNSN